MARLIDEEMGAAALSHIFEHVVQDTDAIAFYCSGLDLGLAVVRELVHTHDHQIEAHSAGSGRKSDIKVTLPLVETKALPGGV